MQKQTVFPGKPCLIPFFQDDAVIKLGTTSMCNIVIVEKEAVFTKLVNNYNKLSTNTMLITGKGFPDFLTRLFLKKLEQYCSKSISDCSIFTDADPYGISIALNYTHSNERNAYICTMANYKGIRITQVLAQNNEVHNKSIQLLSLNQRDYSLAKNLIVSLTANSWDIATSPLKNVVIECQREIFFQKKAEMNEIDTRIFKYK
ncbi:meiosis-specific protein SPO11 [Saccharomyces cerevisiae]|nr:meiosis-specific protein SPO11 [Saccharomyces cerevisiae]